MPALTGIAYHAWDIPKDTAFAAFRLICVKCNPRRTGYLV